MTDVTVISTVYNEEDNLERTAESILDQTYTDFEWILVDDHSTDATPDLLADLESRDSRVRVDRPETRPGRARALNHAVELAEGEYIAQQDIDDRSYPKRLEVQIDHLDTNPAIGAVGCYYEHIDRIRNEKYVRKYPTDHEAIVKALGRHIPIAHNLATFRKAAWRDVGGYPRRDDLEEDYAFWIEMVKAGWCLSTVPEVLGNHIVYEDSNFHRKFDYGRRQRQLAKLQIRAIQEFDLPIWMYAYPVGRYVYPYVPNPVKRFLRRTVGGIREDSE